MRMCSSNNRWLNRHLVDSCAFLARRFKAYVGTAPQTERFHMGLTSAEASWLPRTLEPWLDGRSHWAGLCIDWESARLYTALEQVRGFLKGEHQHLPGNSLLWWGDVLIDAGAVPSLPCLAQPIGFFMMYILGKFCFTLFVIIPCVFLPLPFHTAAFLSGPGFYHQSLWNLGLALSWKSRVNSYIIQKPSWDSF